MLFFSGATAQAQFPQSVVFEKAPVAYWIAPPDVPGDAFSVFHVRKSFTLTAVPEQFIVHVSGDNRYRLAVNGQLVSTGPQRSDLMHWRYESLDLVPYLHAGDNLLTAVVWNWGPHKPVAQFSNRSGFLMQGHSPFEAELVNSDDSWKIWHNEAYEPLPVSGREVGGYYAAPPGESVDGTLYPWGWESADYDDTHWPKPEITQGFGAAITRLRGTARTGEANSWQLVPRMIPQMEETLTRFDRVRRTQGIETDGAFLKGTGDLVISPHATVSLLTPVMG